ncbi:hypothetical protein BX600DRAFT_527920 [Xylariales sp. PMI_506]|nr:hypothetical protein BX600DRAFT_527920 [Xylariales sp. PMI_506]
MALARSASGPGGLSINTASANLFGSSSSNPAPAGGLFGSTSQAANQPSTATASGLFGGAASTAPKTGGLFGNTATTATQPAQSGGLFGASTTTNQPAAATGGGGLFGAASNNNNATAGGGGGLFGGAANNNTAAAGATGGGLFGNTASNTQQQQPQQSGGLFGSSTQAAQPAQTGGGGLFGSAAANQNQTQNTGSSLFNKPSAFGSTTTNNQSTLGQPGLTLGQSTNQQTVPGVRIDVSNVRGTTRFNDLQEDLQKQITEVDKIIQAYISQKNELDAFMPGHGEMLQRIPEDVKFVQRKSEGVEGALHSDVEAIEHVRTLIKQDADDARLSFRAVDNLKLPQQYHTSGLWSSRQQASGSANTEGDGQEIVGFFSKTADEMDEQLRRYERNLSEIETHMHGVQASLIEQLQRMMAAKNGGSTPADEKLAELGAVLRDFEQSIIEVAQRVGGGREGVTRLQLGELMGGVSDRNGLY